MKKLFTSFKHLAPLYLVWIITICLVGMWSIRHLPFNPSFPYYHDLSSFYSQEVAAFAHFDGIHYLRLIHKGYDDTGSQAFFPVYPLLIRALSFGVFDPLYVGIIFNSLCLLVALVLLARQLSTSHLKRFLFLFLTFPTSFFLLANYTESLFVLLVVIFFHFMYQKKFLLSAVVAGIASGTRLIGVFLMLSLAIELFNNRKNIYYSALLLFISVIGLIGFMYFLYIRFGDPLMFVHVQSLFGANRSDGQIILLPQVIYRYIRIFLTTVPTSLLFIRALWEFVTFSLSLVALYFSRLQLPLSALLFCLLAILLPTLSGTLSSFPRYLLVCVPLFLVIAPRIPRRFFWGIITLQYAILIGAIALFVQGIFIA